MPVTTLQWLLALHVTGAFLLLGGAAMSSVLGVLAYRAERPSEVALYLGLARVAVPFIIVGSLLTLVLGLWLVHEASFDYASFWVIASIVLWVAAGGAGSRGGEREDKVRRYALELAASGDEPSTELSARLRDPRTAVLSWGSLIAILALLALMVWKPGA